MSLRAPRTGGEPARPRGVEELCEEFVAVCESAVHPLEIAGALEFDGWTDQALRKRYGVSDVFTLAEEMYRRVPRRPAAPPALPDPWKVSRWRPALHGLLYSIPAVCFAAASGLLTGRDARPVMITALLVSWTLSQGLAYLGYLRLGQRSTGRAQRVLLAGLIVGLAAVTAAVTATAMAVSASVTVVIFGAAMGCYMLGATVLLVLGAEQHLALALAPGVLGGAAYLLAGRPPQLQYVAWAVLAATPLLALAFAVSRTIPEGGLLPRGRSPAAGRGPAARQAGLVSVADLRAALPSAGFGLVAGGLLVFPVAVTVPGDPAASGALLASLPLPLSMGAAEWMLVWFRRRTQQTMRSTRTLAVFATRARLLLAAVVLQYVLTAALLTTAVVMAAAATRLVHPQWSAALPEIIAYLELGCSLFIALLLNAFGSRLVPLTACAVALVTEITFSGSGTSIQIGACTALLTVLAAYAGAVLGSAARHAC